MSVSVRRVLELWPLAAAASLAALWPVSAQLLHPVALPLALAVVGMALLIVHRPDVGVAVVLVLASFTNAEIGGGRPVRFVVAGLSVGLFAYGLFVGSRRPVRLPGNLAPAIVVFLISATFSSLVAIDPGRALTRLLGIVSAALLLFAVVRLCTERRQLVIVIAGAVIGLLLAGGLGVGQKITGAVSESGAVIDGEIIGRVAGTFSHSNQYASFLMVLIPLASALALSRAFPGSLRVLAAAGAALALAALAFSLTRGAVLGLVAGSLLWLAVVRPRTALIVAAVVAVAGATLAPSALRERLSDSGGSDVGLRSDLWRSALDIYSERPLFGVGVANFATGYSQLPATLTTGSQRRLLHQSQVLVPPHANNVYLTVLAEQGTFGLIGLVWLLGSSLMLCSRIARSRDRLAMTVGIGVGAGLCAMLLHAMLELTFFGEMALPVFALLGVASVLAAQAD